MSLLNNEKDFSSKSLFERVSTEILSDYEIQAASATNSINEMRFLTGISLQHHHMMMVEQIVNSIVSINAIALINYFKQEQEVLLKLDRKEEAIQMGKYIKLTNFLNDKKNEFLDVIRDFSNHSGIVY